MSQQPQGYQSPSGDHTGQLVTGWPRKDQRQQRHCKEARRAEKTGFASLENWPGWFSWTAPRAKREKSKSWSKQVQLKPNLAQTFSKVKEAINKELTLENQGIKADLGRGSPKWGFLQFPPKLNMRCSWGNWSNQWLEMFPKDHSTQRSTQKHPQNLRSKNFTKFPKTQSKEQRQEKGIGLRHWEVNLIY